MIRLKHPKLQDTGLKLPIAIPRFYPTHFCSQAERSVQQRWLRIRQVPALRHFLCSHFIVFNRRPSNHFNQISCCQNTERTQCPIFNHLCHGQETKFGEETATLKLNTHTALNNASSLQTSFQTGLIFVCAQPSFNARKCVPQSWICGE